MAESTAHKSGKIMINYDKKLKTLKISNKRIAAEISLDGCFCLQQLKNPIADINIGKQKNYLLAFDRTQYDLAVPGSCATEVIDQHRTDCGNGDEIVVKLSLTHHDGKLDIEKHIILYDDTAALRIYDLFTADSDLANIYYSDLLNFEFYNDCQFKCVNYFSCTDQSNYRLLETEGCKKNKGIFLIAKKSAEDSIFFYKEGPVPDSQPIKGEYDFTIDKQNITCLGLGFEKILRNETRRANGIVIGFTGDTETMPLLRHYQNIRYDINAVDVEFLSNSWPAFHSDVNEEKMLKELEIAARAGLDTVFIDDGWFKPFMGDFDKVKFPDKFDRLAKSAKENDLKVGLWMNPFGLTHDHPKAQVWDGAECRDALTTDIKWNWVARSKDFRAVDISEGANDLCYYGMDMMNQEYFEYIKQRIISMYNDYGIKRFKFDLYRLHVLDTLLGDPNQHYEVYRKLLTELKTAIPDLVISMDITRQSRPGFDFAMDYGRLFMENRGRTHNESDHRYYHPYITLGNLWNTAKYVPAQKIEVEIMPQIDDYPLDYILSTAIFANPLYWGSLAELSNEKIKEIHDFYDSIKTDRERILNGQILTAGEMPEKGTWSTFISCSDDCHEENEFYIGVYKNGSNDCNNEFVIDLFSDTNCSLVNVRNSQEIIEMKNGKFTAEINEPFGFKLYKSQR
jgi:melibiase-like protein